MNQRRNMLRGLAAGGLSVWMSHLGAAGSQPPPPGVRKVRGEVWINGTRAQVGQLVRSGDTVTTGVGSETVFVMGTNAYLMRDSSRVSFLGDEAKNVMRVITGKVLSVFGPGDRRIETATATIGIRGTGCYIEGQENRVYFCLCYGSAEVVPIADPTQSQKLTTRYHDSPFYIGTDTARRLMESAPVINHRDFELILLENAVGRQPPFQGQIESRY